MILKQTERRKDELDELKELYLIHEGYNRSLIKQEISRIETGLEGEREVAHFLKREFGPSETMLVINDLRIQSDNDYAQTDHIVIDIAKSIIWVLETKSYSGIISCNRHGDWTVEYERRGEIHIDSPVSQCERHCTTIERWLASRTETKFTIIPIVVISSKTGVQRFGMKTDCEVLKSYNVVKTIKSQGERFPTSRKFDRQETIEIFRQMVAEHKPSPQANLKRKLGISHRPNGKQNVTGIRSRSHGNRKQTKQKEEAQRALASLVMVGVFFIVMIFGFRSFNPVSHIKTPELKESVSSLGQWPASFPRSGTIQWKDGKAPEPNPKFGQIQIYDQTGSGTSKVIRIRKADGIRLGPIASYPPEATAYNAPGKTATVNLPQGVYEITVLTGRAWNSRQGFLKEVFAANYGMISVNANEPAVIVMGAPDQSVENIPVKLF